MVKSLPGLHADSDSETETGQHEIGHDVVLTFIFFFALDFPNEQTFVSDILQLYFVLDTVYSTHESCDMIKKPA